MTIREFKPRKAKYGFEISLGYEVLKEAALIQHVCIGIGAVKKPYMGA